MRRININEYLYIDYDLEADNSVNKKMLSNTVFQKTLNYIIFLIVLYIMMIKQVLYI